MKHQRGLDYNAGVPGNLAPPKYGPPGPNFLGNMAPPGAIFPRKFGPPFGNLAPLYKHGVKQFCVRAMHCKCINFVTYILFNARMQRHVCEYTNNLHKDIVYKATNDQHKKHKRLEALNRPSDPVNTFEERYRKHKIFYYVQIKTIWHLNFAI